MADFERLFLDIFAQAEIESDPRIQVVGDSRHRVIVPAGADLDKLSGKDLTLLGPLLG